MATKTTSKLVAQAAKLHAAASDLEQIVMHDMDWLVLSSKDVVTIRRQFDKVGKRIVALETKADKVFAR